MPFTDEEKVRIRHAMGYLNVSEVSTFQMGIPAAVETQYLIETAMNKVLPEAETFVRNLLSKLDAIESQMMENLENIAVESIDEITLNPKEMSKLRREYKHWQLSLANVLGIPPNPNDQRLFGAGISVGVAH
jgi:hypothetical protein